MDLSGTLILELCPRRRLELEINFSIKQTLPTGILNWQEFGHIPFQELIDRTHALNSIPEEPTELD
jgi:hypothetical protein